MPNPKSSAGDVRLAVLGAGRWGRNCIRTIQSLPGVELAGLYSTNPESAGLVEDSSVIAGDWRHLIDTFDGEGIVIATPPEHHAAMVERAAGRGLAVMVEKPLTMDLDEALRLSRAVADTGVTLLVDHVHLFNPAYQKLKEVALGLGPCRRVESAGGDTGGRQTSAPPLWDFGAHDVSLALDFLGYQGELISATRSEAHAGEVFELRLGFPSSALADIVIGNGLPAKMRMFAAHFDEEVLVFDDLAPRRLVRHRGVISLGDAATPPESEGEAVEVDATPPLSVALQMFAAGIRGSEWVGFGLNLGVAVVRLLSRAATQTSA
jgi:predicted dehydrogenase